MQPTVEQKPFELLVRWGADGSITGAHLRWQYRVMQGDVIVSHSEGEPIPLSLGDGTFPLSDLDDVIQSSALVTMDEALQAQRRAEAERDAAIAERDRARTELAQLHPDIAI